MLSNEGFIKKAPVAKVEEEKLLKLWEGLGYYNRARNLKKAAMQIETEYGGAIPTTWEQLKKLPGIGEYTAGAVASICFGEKVPAVDGNVHCCKTKTLLVILFQNLMELQ